MVLQKGRQLYGTYILRLKAVNCDVTFTPRTARPGQTIGSSAALYAKHEVYIDVSLPEGYVLATVALTDADFTKVVRISNERIQQDGGRYKLTAPDDINARDLNVLVMAIRADAKELT